MAKRINWKKPVYDVDECEVEVLKVLSNGGAVIFRHDEKVGKVDKYGRSIRTGNILVRNEEPEVVEFISLYPDNKVYKNSCCPVQNSIYGVENLIQIKVTRRGGKIVRKEFC